MCSPVQQQQQQQQQRQATRKYNVHSFEHTSSEYLALMQALSRLPRLRSGLALWVVQPIPPADHPSSSEKQASVGIWGNGSREGFSPALSGGK
ncbi:hypothetical protein KM043_012746 [Ampulex compressa]|nr:hypothetical protein KM043_012746 [Ampulex compressa]